MVPKGSPFYIIHTKIKIMERVLVKFEANWADEMDVQGFSVMTKERWKEACKTFKQIKNKNGICYYFGSNEGWEDGEIDDSWLENYTVVKITEEQERVLEDLDLLEFGTFPMPDDFESEDDEDDGDY